MPHRANAAEPPRVRFWGKAEWRTAICLARSSHYALAPQTERRIFVVMIDEWNGDVYVVATTNGKKTEYWAAAVPQHRVLAEVQTLLRSGWRASLSRRQLTRQMISDLNMRDGSVRQLRFNP